MPDFIPGLDLCRRFYKSVVKPILDADFPDVVYSAALIGYGSEVLGFDSVMSTDHHWGPRLMLFLHPDDYAQYRDVIHETLRKKLPHQFLGYPTNFGDPIFDGSNRGTQLLQETETGPVNHRVEIRVVEEYFQAYLGVDINATLDAADWLTIPSQKLLAITAGEVFYDGIGLQAIRDQFAYYPHDVWLYLLTSAWSHVGEEEHLAPRAGYVGDELGSAVIAGRIVQYLMRLCFLLERQYAPYPKWFGSAFARLECAATLAPILRQAQIGETWRERESHLCQAYTVVAQMHNGLGITESLPTEPSTFHDRPFKVIQGWRFAEAISAMIQDPLLKRLAEQTPIGSIDQFSDSTPFRERKALRHALRQLYQ
jgi:hypothetical protein